MINITFPDGAVREFESGVTTFEIAQSISNSLAKKALAGKFNGKLIDTTRAITEDGSIEIVTPDHEDALTSCVTQLLTCLHKPLVAFSQTFTWVSVQPSKMVSTTIQTTKLVKSLTKTFLVSKKKCKKSSKKTSHQS